MCSIGDDNLEVQGGASTFATEKKYKFNSDTKCNKCRTEKPQVVLRNKDAYCKNCFLVGTNHKFKSLLGKNRLVNRDDRVLVCYKGGHPSTALLHMLRSGLDLTTPKKLRFVPVIVFIEDNYDLNVEERFRILSEVSKEIKYYGFPTYFISLIKYMNETEDFNKHLHEDIDSLILSNKDNEVLAQVVDEKANLTTKLDILQIFERQLTVDVAKTLNCQCVFLPDIAVDIASQLLTNVSLGRGAHLAIDIGICDTRDEDVKIIKPLRIFDIKELAFYNAFNNLEPVSVLNTTPNPYSSVKYLIEKFITDLQTNYPATITTILRTGDKLAMDKEMVRNSNCILCKAPKQNHSDVLTSAEATRFSHILSTTAHNSSDLLENIASQNFNDLSDSQYCFACSKIVHHIK